MAGQWGGARPGAGRPADPSRPARPRRAGSTKLKRNPIAPIAAQPRQAASFMSAGQMMAVVEALKAQNAERRGGHQINPFQLPVFPKSAMPPKDSGLQMAMDEGMTFGAGEWANAVFAGMADEGLGFLGFQYLAQLAQRPEYRIISETIADDATRKWIDFEVTGNADEERAAKEKDPVGYAERMVDPDERKKRLAAAGKTDKVKALKDDQNRLGVRDNYYELSRIDGFLGRSHLYYQIGDVGLDNASADELKSSIGDSRDQASLTKVQKGSLKALRVIEATWCYPTTYNAMNPLAPDWFNPQFWYVFGKQVHKSRLPAFISHPVLDILKPAYAFGGLSNSQMVKPYVDIWLTTRQSVADLVHSFSVMVLETDLSTLIAPGNAAALLARIALFNELRDNNGTFLINKNTEGFQNVSASLAGLHELQAQAQEHMAAIPRIPLVKFTGISPSGLNACLPGDTMILTDRGQVPIREVTLSDQVMTREGFAPLTFSGITEYATELVEITTESAVLRCTANHPIWLSSTNEFVRAENVRHGDRLLLIGGKNVAPNMDSPWRGAGNGGGRTRSDTISLGMPLLSERFTSIGKFGKRIADRFQKVSTSTTSTVTKETINSIILSRCMELFMPSTTASNLNFGGGAAALQPKFVLSATNRSSSTPQARRNSVATPACSPIDEQTACLRPSPLRSAVASCVARLLARFARMPSFVRANAQLRAKTGVNTAAHTISHTQKNISEPLNNLQLAEPVVSVRKIPANEPVYDLSVATGHLPEFFANRILTHNSSEGEIAVYDDTIAAYQNRVFRPELTRTINFEQLSMWGEIDPEITFVFEPLRVMTEKEKGEKQKAEAERDQIYVDMGAIAPEEVRQRVIDDPELPYAGLDPNDVPDLAAEEAEGLDPGNTGGGAQPEPDKTDGGNQ